jgi:hypothetical protein
VRPRRASRHGTSRGVIGRLPDRRHYALLRTTSSSRQISFPRIGRDTSLATRNAPRTRPNRSRHHLVLCLHVTGVCLFTLIFALKTARLPKQFDYEEGNILNAGLRTARANSLSCVRQLADGAEFLPTNSILVVCAFGEVLWNRFPRLLSFLGARTIGVAGRRSDSAIRRLCAGPVRTGRSLRYVEMEIGEGCLTRNFGGRRLGAWHTFT